jgi:hypothetical protein
LDLPAKLSFTAIKRPVSPSISDSESSIPHAVAPVDFIRSSLPKRA